MIKHLMVHSHERIINLPSEDIIHIHICLKKLVNLGKIVVLYKHHWINTWHDIRVQIAEKLFIETKLFGATANQSRMWVSFQVQGWCRRLSYTKVASLLIQMYPDKTGFSPKLLRVKVIKCDDCATPIFLPNTYPACKANVIWSCARHPPGNDKVKEAKNSSAQRS